MTTSKSSEVLTKIGIDMNSSQMLVFRAILTAANGFSKPVTYKEVDDALGKLTKKKYTKAYVYRQLSSLEEEGYIIVDAIQHPQQYGVSESALSNALKRKSQNALSNLLSKRQVITTELNLLETTNPEELAFAAYNSLAGIHSNGESVIIEGIENVRSAVIREFADGAKSGDHIRVMAPAATLIDGLGPGGMTELRLIQGASKGVKIHGMLTPYHQDEMSIELIAGHLKTLTGAFSKAVGTGNVEVRVAKEPIQTYRMVSLNNDKMLLYLTHAKESDVAALIHRGNNAGLIDDAVSTFDRLWKNGLNVVETITKMINTSE